MFEEDEYVDDEFIDDGKNFCIIQIDYNEKPKPSQAPIQPVVKDQPK